jgi:hypothetical protein
LGRCESGRVCMGFQGFGEGVEGCVDGAYLLGFCETGLWLEAKGEGGIRRLRRL